MSKLLEQRIVVKVVSGRIFVRYECEHEEPLVFVLSNVAALQVSGMLESAARIADGSNKEYEVGISI